jgi:RND family efflux transporter MFP subunit
MSAVSETLMAHRPWKHRHLWIPLGVLAVLTSGFLAGYLPRRIARTKLVAATPTAPMGPRVAVTTAIASDAGRVLTLPAALSANQQTLVYARASGYVRRWLVDIGDRVKHGQLLLELDTPELDRQLSQARASWSQTRAALAQANANRDYAYVTARREAQLFAKSLISAQENDQARTQAAVWDANVNAAKANVAAQRAEVDRLQQLVSFGRVTAPFTGTITKRLVDVGTLVNAGAGTTAAALFEIASTDPMEAYVEVPQVFAPSIHPGYEARVAVRNYRGRIFAARIARTAGALDPASRTLRTELELPNPKGELLAGMYVEVSLDVAVSHQDVAVPSSAIVADSRGVHVAVVDTGGKVHLRPVTTGLDNGNSIELVAGLSGGEQVITAPPAGVTDGMQVQPVTAK